ncbi:MAG: hypothetical protein GC190_11900 [Alphaproteobacteria bacterium]|nr:hypothetical protein [Alphaproteobacteria bacterium]
MIALRFLLVAVGVSLSTASAIAGILTVINKTDENVTVNVDGGYGCTAAAHSSCTAPPQPNGHHQLSASTPSGASLTQEIEMDGDYTWTISYQ